VVTTKYLAKFQSPRAITRPKIIGPERNVNLICNLSLYTHKTNIKSISKSIAKKSGRNCFISELRTWVTLSVHYAIWTSDSNFLLAQNKIFWASPHFRHWQLPWLPQWMLYAFGSFLQLVHSNSCHLIMSTFEQTFILDIFCYL
jgi:hypothetical protein